MTTCLLWLLLALPSLLASDVDAIMHLSRCLYSSQHVTSQCLQRPGCSAPGKQQVANSGSRPSTKQH